MEEVEVLELLNMESGLKKNNKGSCIQFDNCISLGWFCGTALSMIELGLRNFSGPFDWFLSDFESVLYMIENDFTDFMLKENLEVLKDDSKVFQDVKYGFYCNHDISNDFEKEYPDILKKYEKRVKRFIEETKKPTCFIRAVRSEEEISYIKKNMDYIYSVIKKGNVSNDIIFILTKNMTGLGDELLWFRIDDCDYVGEIYEMRTMFKSSKELIHFCQNEILSAEKMKTNLLYEKQKLSKEHKNVLVIKRIRDNNLCILAVFENVFRDVHNVGIYIWGAGEFGTLISKYAIDNGIKINGIIDYSEEKVGTLINGIRVIPFGNSIPDYANILIAISSEVAEHAIISRVNSCKKGIKMLTFNSIYGYLDIPELLWF